MHADIRPMSLGYQLSYSGSLWLVMSPSRAEGFSAQLGSARDLFSFSSKSKIGPKRAENEPKFGFHFLKNHFTNKA